MENTLQNLILALRSSGVRISVSETLDAMRAARLTGFGSRRILKDALGSALAKSKKERDLFDECFERYFSPDGFLEKEEGAASVPDALPGPEDSPLSRMLLSGETGALSLSMRAAAREINISSIRFFTQKSLYIQRIMRAMGGEGLQQDITRLSRGTDEASRVKAHTLRESKDLLFEGVRDFVEQQFGLFAESAGEKIMERYLRNVRLSNLEQHEFHRMHGIIGKMAKRLNDMHSRRRKTAKRGRLDLKKTLRKNLAFQGLLFDPQWKARRIDRPDIVILCDVSRSVEAVARFMLLFLYCLNEEVARIRSYIFCSNLVCVSAIFEGYGVDEALERLQRGVGLEIRFGRTDYGRAFEDFREQWLHQVTNRTTILILGDARNNYGNPRTDILSLLHERARRLIWLNPEPRNFWGTGDSEMRRYLPYCYLARECSTVNHLQRVVDYLLSAPL